MPFGEHNTWDFFPHKLYREEINDPYKAVNDFFQRMKLTKYLADLDDWFAASCTSDFSLKQRFPDLVCLIEDIERMLEAAWLISQVHPPAERKTIVTLPSRQDIEARLKQIESWYVNRFRSVGIWDCFPRYLSADEMLDPYRVFHALFRLNSLPAWKDELKMLFEAAISNYSIYESLGSSNFYMTCTYLYKMVEAAFIINLIAYETTEQPACGANAVV